MEDGIIVGKSAKAKPQYGLLVNDRGYQNFVLRVKFRVLEGNSGFYFRANETKTYVADRGFRQKSTEPAPSEDSITPPCESG